MPLEVHPVSADRWDDLERLFGPNGAVEGCWCMYLRHTAREHQANGSAGNRRAMNAIVQANRIPGLLAYDGDRPVGWVFVAPRTEYGRVERSPTTRPIDDEPAWSIVCFFVDPNARGLGAARTLLEAAIQHARDHGATLLEAYPVDTRNHAISATEAWHGTQAMYETAGFTEVARRTPHYPILRRHL